MGDDFDLNKILYSNPKMNFNFGTNTLDNQATENISVFNPNNINAQIANQQGIDYNPQQDNSGGLFSNWNQQSTANTIKGLGLGANIYFGAQNLSLAKKNFGIKKEQHKAWMEDRAEAKTKRDAVSAIRF